LTPGSLPRQVKKKSRVWLVNVSARPSLSDNTYLSVTEAWLSDKELWRVPQVLPTTSVYFFLFLKEKRKRTRTRTRTRKRKKSIDVHEQLKIYEQNTHLHTLIY